MAFLLRLGVLRGLLLFCVLICCPLVWLADTEPVGWGVVTSYVIPSLVVLLGFVLLLDALMNRIFMLEKGAEKRAVQQFRLWSDLGAFFLLLVCWLPYFSTIGSG